MPTAAGASRGPGFPGGLFQAPEGPVTQTLRLRVSLDRVTYCPFLKSCCRGRWGDPARGHQGCACPLGLSPMGPPARWTRDAADAWTEGAVKETAGLTGSGLVPQPSPGLGLLSDPLLVICTPQPGSQRGRQQPDKEVIPTLIHGPRMAWPGVRSGHPSGSLNMGITMTGPPRDPTGLPSPLQQMRGQCGAEGLLGHRAPRSEAPGPADQRQAVE